MLVEVVTGMRRHPGIKCLSDADSGIGWKKGIPDVRLEHATSCWRSSWAVPRFERCDEYVLSLTSPRGVVLPGGVLVYLLLNCSKIPCTP